MKQQYPKIPGSYKFVSQDQKSLIANDYLERLRNDGNNHVEIKDAIPLRSDPRMEISTAEGERQPRNYVEKRDGSIPNL